MESIKKINEKRSLKVGPITLFRIPMAVDNLEWFFLEYYYYYPIFNIFRDYYGG